jgi:cation diffusion facilitator CzcD-associated flavoprotein CzcO
MSQPNVELVTDAIERITEGGIVTADGQERAIDVLVCATGFETVQLLSRSPSPAWADARCARPGPTAPRPSTASAWRASPTCS